MQRYLTARSLDEARSSLLMSAYWKIPLQALVLLVGVLLFVFYLFTPRAAPVQHACSDGARQGQRAGRRLRAPSSSGSRRPRDAGLQPRLAFVEARRTRRRPATDAAAETLPEADASLAAIRREAGDLVGRVTGERYNDVNYVFPTFIMSRMPVGLVGLILAAIFAAAMSSIAAELNALSTATVIDFYRRYVRTDAPDAHYLTVSRAATGAWGLFACLVAIWAAELGSLIEVVNRFGSFFYGSILGVFLLAILWKRANGHGAFIGLICGMATVALRRLRHQDRVPLAQRRRCGVGLRRRHRRQRRRPAPRVALDESAPLAAVSRGTAFITKLPGSITNRRTRPAGCRPRDHVGKGRQPWPRRAS